MNSSLRSPGIIKILFLASFLYGLTVGLLATVIYFIIGLGVLFYRGPFDPTSLVLSASHVQNFTSLICFIVFFIIGIAKLKLKYEFKREGAFYLLFTAIPINLYVHIFVADSRFTIFGLIVLVTSLFTIFFGRSIFKKVWFKVEASFGDLQA